METVELKTVSLHFSKINRLSSGEFGEVCQRPIEAGRLRRRSVWPSRRSKPDTQRSKGGASLGEARIMGSSTTQHHQVGGCVTRSKLNTCLKCTSETILLSHVKRRKMNDLSFCCICVKSIQGVESVQKIHLSCLDLLVQN